MRLFVALDLPEDVRCRLSRLGYGLPGARMVPEEQLHLSLCFIGEVEGGMYPDIRDALARVDFPSFTLQLDGVGFFPPRKKPRVVWAGVVCNASLSRLHKKIKSVLLPLGIALEKRKFAPHITLARLKNTPAARVGRFLEQNSLFMTEPFQVDEFVLYSSVLNSRGARHYVEQRFFLS
ncbi:MAG: RNA 2',3'-cyclic phosphodiesterase [Desulfobulbus sp.]|nr:MAG: RNA 2',3'-cyclic phosphodiesterase [Desulfobulbus sp.]RUM36191.1 MAG: RNA 2',3'-cyclic phosphodiesterase [Desulfobulbus sp.]RUM38802.1 MAG: RNA 2',3'-cyclic phosphodiesterase [Desulfobulbus sp.]